MHLVFLLLTPEADYGGQLQIIAGLSKRLVDNGVRERLRHAGEEKLWALLTEVVGAPSNGMPPHAGSTASA